MTEQSKDNKQDDRIFYNNCGNCCHNWFERKFHFLDHKIRMTYEEWCDT